ncbi:putative Nudix hydrolase 14, chloroplastic [Blattamonas nauphoetae]|uniref:Nudix hydrolase 14, chloroplastic n=1 Tax=Blattamonas nauphoetae TaxID=2049346 RepID=A0ABQ9YKZ4_9EUKA|nr:putative Nudix hydrolase 14, chloroplastic [Blattamonas nauphoetae]
MSSVIIKDTAVPVTGLTGDIDVQRVIDTFVPFQDWVKSVDAGITVKSILIQNVDATPNRILFVKMKVEAYVADGTHPIPGIILLRGGAVACLVEVICENQSYALLVEQPRLAVGKSNFLEAVAGMIDGSSNFAGVVVQEMKEETGISLTEKDMIDLTELAHGKEVRGFYPSVGLCDEFIRLYLYRVEMTKSQMTQLEGKLAGLTEHGEYIRLKIVPLDSLWKATHDSKTLACLYLRDKLLAEGRIPGPLPYNPQFS